MVTNGSTKIYDRYETSITLNDYIKVCRANKYNANKYKTKLEHEIGLFLAKMPKWDNPIKIHFHWVEGTKKRDIDNVAFAKKFILDSMVKNGKLTDDNRRYVTAFTDTFEYSDTTKVILEIEEISKDDK